MTLPASDRLRRIHFLNTLFGDLTGRDPYLAEQIRSAIALSLGELEEQVRGDPTRAEREDAAFAAAAVKLLHRHFEGRTDHGFAHWDAAATVEAADPLFARAGVMEALRSLARFPEGTLLITNLRPALLPAGARRTPKREEAYRQMLDYIRELSAARTARNFTLNLLFL